MLAQNISEFSQLTNETTAAPGSSPAEHAFYADYAWTLNPNPTFRSALGYLDEEIRKLAGAPIGWQSNEIATNVYLLACALLNCIDEYLRGPTLKLPRKLASTSLGRGAKKIAEIRPANWRGWTGPGRWRDRWVEALDGFLVPFVLAESIVPESQARAAAGLLDLLRAPLPADLTAQAIAIPSPYGRLDLTHLDVLALARRFIERSPDRSQKLLLVGLRTSGSYFGPLMRAFLVTQGYAAVSFLTIEPNKGPGRLEFARMRRHARAGYTALLVDDPPHTAGTIYVSLGIAGRAGFAPDKVKVLVPTHPARRNWAELLPESRVVSLEPEQWHVPALLRPEAAQERIAEYFRADGFIDAVVVESAEAADLNVRLRNASGDARGSRMKRVFEVRVRSADGREKIRYVLAKSVGWGWLGYHAFLAGKDLARFVPRVLGLREGVLFSEWIPQTLVQDQGAVPRNEWIGRSAAYVAARVNRLGLGADPLRAKGQQRHQNGLRLLEKTLARAYGGFIIDQFMQASVGRWLRAMNCPFPTLIDGKMARAEWVLGPDGPLKTDYEHHGMGKGEINLCDPAYDLADTIFNLALDPVEERELIRQYVAETGDSMVDQRIFIHKLLAGLWAMEQAQDGLLGKPRSVEEQRRLHARFMDAWHFLTIQTARRMGAASAAVDSPVWRGPLIFLDIDGVIDSRPFGFPCTTPAGVEALALLRSRGLSIALNTARSAAEVKEYCAAYGLAGGVAEHGAYLWDAVAGRGRVLLTDEALRQLELLREVLRRTPGVFLDDRHLYSIRAHTYRDKPSGMAATLLASARASNVGDGALSPLPVLVIQNLMTSLELDRLSFHQTGIDTTIVAKDVDKGVGLIAMRDWASGPDAETIAIGDSETDLAMFRVVTRCYAPANISCAAQAKMLNCRIMPGDGQRGLLDAARAVTGGEAVAARRNDVRKIRGEDGPACMIFDLLHAVDRGWRGNLKNALLGRFSP